MGSTPVVPNWGDDELPRNPPPPQPKEIAPEDEPPAVVVPKVIYICQGVKAKGLTRTGEPHPLDLLAKPEGGTTDASSKWMRGLCGECRAITIWKGATT